VEVADPLKLAAECLERGDDAAALVPLTKYVEANPEHAAIRAHLAEVLLRQGQRAAARRAYQADLADAEGRGERKNLIHVHTRLVDIAVAEGDEYRERLHRGIGLFLLAKQMQAAPEDDGPNPEKLLFKAAEELKNAAKSQPNDARPHWYLYEVWTHL